MNANELEILKKYVVDIYRSKDEVAIVKEFAKSMLDREHNAETKVILSLIVRNLDKPIKRLEEIQETILSDVKNMDNQE